MRQATTDPLPFLPVERIAALSAEIDLNGIGIWENVVPARVLNATKKYIDGELQRTGNQYFTLQGSDWLDASPLGPIGKSHALYQVIASLSGRAMQRIPDQQRIAASLQVVTGTRGLKHADLFHYDSYVVTALLPISIPQGQHEPAGELVFFPNLRSIRRNAYFNICEKALLENPLACQAWGSAAVQRWLGAKVVALEPGNIYFFWGMRTLHANRACWPQSLRSTAIFHFFDPHAGGLLKRCSAAYHEMRLKRLNRP